MLFLQNQFVVSTI